MPDAFVSIMRGRAHIVALWGETKAHLCEPERRFNRREDEMLRPSFRTIRLLPRERNYHSVTQE